MWPRDFKRGQWKNSRNHRLSLDGGPAAENWDLWIIIPNLSFWTCVSAEQDEESGRKHLIEIANSQAKMNLKSVLPKNKCQTKTLTLHPKMLKSLHNHNNNRSTLKNGVEAIFSQKLIENPKHNYKEMVRNTLKLMWIFWSRKTKDNQKGIFM